MPGGKASSGGLEARPGIKHNLVENRRSKEREDGVPILIVSQADVQRWGPALQEEGETGSKLV